jgi:DNA-binding response OmpR family regulator
MARRQAIFRGELLDLRPREFDLLALLAAHPGQVFTREALLRQVWGHEEFVDARTVDVHVRRVRAKLAAIAPDAQIILTEWGVGYKLVMN